MKHKEILFGSDSRLALSNGIDELAKLIGKTYGPKGGNVMFENDGKVIMTKDGVTLANEYYSNDKFANLGARAVIGAARETAQIAGDGTTTTILLASSLFRELNKHIQFSDDSREVIKGATAAYEAVVDRVNCEIMPANRRKVLLGVASVACNGNKKLASAVVDCLEAVGCEGVILTKKDSSRPTISIEMAKGFSIERGMKDKCFINAGGNTHHAQSPFILLYDRRIETFEELANPMRLAAEHKRPLIVIAHSFKEPVIHGMMLNYVNRIVQSCPIQAPQTGSKQLAILRDIAVATGGTVISTELGLTLDSVNVSHFGIATAVEAKELSTIFHGCSGGRESVVRRVNEIKRQIDQCTIQFDRDLLQERLSKMIGAMATIYVGGLNDVEIAERKYLIDDALYSTRSAAEHGIVYGASTSYAYAAEDAKFACPKDRSIEFEAGYLAVCSALQYPLYCLARNAKIRDGVVDNLLEVCDKTRGPNVDLKEEQIYDSAKTVLTALKHAFSVSVSLLSVECAVAIEGFDPVEEGQ